MFRKLNILEFLISDIILFYSHSFGLDNLKNAVTEIRDVTKYSEKITIKDENETYEYRE